MSTLNESPASTTESTVEYRRRVQEAAAFVREQASIPPSLALILATGRDTRPGPLTVQEEWPLDEIPAFPGSEHQNGALAVGTLEGRPVAVLDGSLSLHDGYTPRQVAFPVRMLGEAGVETLLFANTAGSIHPEMAPPDLVLVTDHLNFQGVNPLVGPNVEEWGPRFPDMSEPYDPELRQAAEQVALRDGIRLQQGIYFAVLGPNLGTRAEYRMVRTLGGDLVGTGSILEVIAACHMDLRVLTVSVVVDRCSPDAVEPTPTGELTEAVEAARPNLRHFLGELVAELEDENRSA